MFAASIVVAAEIPEPAPAADIAEAARQYRTYRRMTKEPKAVGANMVFPCASATGSPEFEEAKKRNGPHFPFYLHHYRNEVATRPLTGKQWPVGAIFMKEKLRSKIVPADGVLPVVAVAGMIKRAPGTSSKSGDWEFFFVEKGKVSTTNMESCAGCHSNARDYVFSTFPDPVKPPQ